MSTDRLAQIETGLTLPVVVQGEPAPTFALPDRMEHYAVPAFSFAVIDQGQVALAKAYGVRAAGEALAVTPETQFQAASLSKPVTGLAALRLAAAGLLDLDADVNTYLRTWALPANDLTRQQPVTVRRLLSHTAGVTVHGFPGYPLGDPLPTLVEMLDGLPPANHAPMRVDLLPGSGHRYSGGGYVILQQLLMDLTGETFPALLQRLVFGPLGMTHSGYAVPDPQSPRVALGHQSTGARVPRGFNVYPEYAPAGLWTTPTDLAFFALALTQAYTGQRDALLPQAWAQAMLTPPLGDHALGPAVLGEGEWFGFAHGGSNHGYRCFFIAYPHQGHGAAFMTNGERGTDLVKETVRSVAQAYGWPGYTAKVKVPAPAVPAGLAGLAGRYTLVNFPTESLSILPQADHLQSTFNDPDGQTIAALWPGADGRFFRRDADFEVKFELADAGPALALVAYWDGNPQRALRVPVA